MTSLDLAEIQAIPISRITRNPSVAGLERNQDHIARITAKACPFVIQNSHDFTSQFADAKRGS